MTIERYIGNDVDYMEKKLSLIQESIALTFNLSMGENRNILSIL